MNIDSSGIDQMTLAAWAIFKIAAILLGVVAAGLAAIAGVEKAIEIVGRIRARRVPGPHREIRP